MTPKLTLISWGEYSRECLKYGVPTNGKIARYVKHLEAAPLALKKENARLKELLKEAEHFLTLLKEDYPHEPE